VPQYSQDERIEARVQLSLQRGQRLRLSQYLYAREPRAEVISLVVTAQSFAPRAASIQLLSNGMTVESLQVGRQLMQIPVRALQIGSLDSLELTSLDDVYIETVTAQTRVRPYNPGPQPFPQMQVAPNSLVTLQVNRDIMGAGDIQLDRLVREQLNQTLDGAQIERIAIEGMPSGYSQASVSVELNGCIASPAKYLSAQQRRLPIQLSSFEEVRSLRLLVQGSARIMEVSIRVGNVRPQGPMGPGPQQPYPSRVFVNQEVSPSYPLDLSVFTREYSIVRTLTLETTLRGYAGGEITLMSRSGYTVGRAIAQQGRTVILLTTPTSLSDIRIYTSSPVLVGSIDFQN
jgi:hypothetical protein